MEESPSPVIKLETSTTSRSLKRHKHGDKIDNFHAAILSSRVIEEEIVSPAKLANVCKGSTIGQALRHDSKLISNIATSLSKTPMASPQPPSTMENLSNDLLSNIFIRLLAKQIAQMRSVCKPWNALLSQSSFIKSHFHHSTHNYNQILLVFYKDTGFCDCNTFTAHLSRSPHLELTEFNKLPPVNPKIGSTENIRVIGAVNGLICSTYSSAFTIHIWNPSLNAVSTLPPSPMPSKYSDGFHLRFGFDPKNDDYKVLKIVSAYLDLCDLKWRRHVAVFSMRKGSWEEITQWYPSHIKRISSHYGVCVDGHDGHLHWFGHYNIKKRHLDTIVAFNLGSNTFSEIPFPVSMRDHTTETENLLEVFVGKLCVMAWHDHKVCQVWVMEEYGVAESWVKRLVFSEFVSPTCPYGFTSHNELLYKDDDHLEANDQCLVLYDPIANETKIFEKFICNESHHPHMIVEYVDSLVWVAPAKYEMVDGGGQN